MMTRTCAECGSKKTGAAAAIDPSVGITHDSFWDNMHLPGCKYKKLDAPERMDYLMEHGSPLSSVHEE